MNCDLYRKLINNLNNDEAFCYWARALTGTILVLQDGEKSYFELKKGRLRPTSGKTPDIVLGGTDLEWEKAENTPYNHGIYDVTERPGMLHLEANPVLIAANAKAMTRFFKQLRAVLKGEERSWDWNV